MVLLMILKIKITMIMERMKQAIIIKKYFQNSMDPNLFKKKYKSKYKVTFKKIYLKLIKT